MVLCLLSRDSHGDTTELNHEETVRGPIFLFIFYFILEKPATRPRDRCGKEQLVYPFVTGFPGSSRWYLISTKLLLSLSTRCILMA